MSAFDERSGIVACDTPWGRWWQTIEEVYIEINVPEGTSGKQVKCDISTNHLSVSAQGQQYIQGQLPKPVHADESVWTLEDKKLIRICLDKSDKTASNVWRSLVEGQYEANPFTYDKMQQKMTLQKFQLENPGMDFSGATVSGNYHAGGPNFPT